MSGSSANTKALDGILQEFAGRVPGASVLVQRDGRVLLKRSYGYADLEAGRRAMPRTAYRLASVSKQFTATAILMLAERGLLSLDDPLTRFLPDFPEYGRQIRIRHLLSHTSGLLAYEDLMPEGDGAVLDRDVLEIMRRQDRTYFAPGTKFRYSNSGYALLAMIVEQVSDLSFPEFVERNIFRPLGMKESNFNQRGRPAHSRRAYGYSKRDAGFVRTDQSRTSYVLGDGGIYSSVEDMARWERALQEGRLLQSSVLAAAMSEQVPTGRDGVGYGYGWYVGRHGKWKAVWHEGTTIGFRNFYLRIPDQKLAIIVLTNRNETAPEELARQVADLFLPERP